MTPAELAPFQDPLAIQRVLRSARTVAVVGLSGNALRASHFVGFYLQRHGYRIFPVNPRETQILGQRCYASLPELPEPIDIVNVFRAPSALPEIAAQAIAIGARCLWTQFNVVHLEAAQSAARAGLTVIMDRCIKVEHARYVGRMHWLGLNTGRITAVRSGLE